MDNPAAQKRDRDGDGDVRVQDNELEQHLVSFCDKDLDFACLKGAFTAMRVKDLVHFTEASLKIHVMTHTGLDGLVPRWLSDNNLRRFLKDYQSAGVKKKGKAADEHETESPPAPTGPDIEMTADGVKAFMRGLQRAPGQGGRALNLDLPVHVPDELAIRLSGREAGVGVICNAWRAMNSLAATDRTKFKIMVCSGLSGLGKTRMLEEWETLFDRAGVTGPRLGIIVLYFNGRGLRTMDRVLPAEASFSWRMLHRLFLDGQKDTLNGPALQTFFRQHLPANAKDLKLEVALQAVLSAAKDANIVKDGERLSLFLGVDEYQTIPEMPVDAEGRAPLQRIVAELVNCNATIPGLQLFPMFAGSDWSKMSIARSATADTLRVPLQLLPSRDAEAAIASRPDLRGYLASTVFRRQVFFLGGVPRFFVEYAESVKGLGNSPDSDAIVEAGRSVWESRVTRAWAMDAPSYIRLVAHAVAGVGVIADSAPGIGAHPKGNNALPLQHDFKWRHLADMGVCTLDQNDPDDVYCTVGIPYCVVRLAAHLQEYDAKTDAEKALVQNLRWLREHVDSRAYDLEPWQLWEKFGAVFHAMRINALIIVRGDCGPVSFSSVCNGATMNGCDYDIVLRPMRVMATDAKFGANLPALVSEKENGNKTINWLESGWVLLNAAGGVGVDVFFALRLASGPGFLVCADQRKREAGSLGQRRAATLAAKARVKLACLPEKSVVVVGLFSMFPSYNREADELPYGCFVVSFREHHAYHGCFVLHPASSPCVDVNRDNQSMLELLGGVSKKLAREIIAKREQALFADIDDLKKFLRASGVSLSEVDEERVIVFGSSV